MTFARSTGACGGEFRRCAKFCSRFASVGRCWGMRLSVLLAPVFIALVVGCQEPEDMSTPTPDAAVVTCMPKTCAELGAQCGSHADGCGGSITCGTCGGSMTCNAAGHCEGNCTPTTCGAQ